MHTFILYATENQDVADNIKENLEQTGISVILDNRLLEKRSIDKQELASKPNAPIILLITDNFLRNKDCMYEALGFLRHPSLKARVYPVVADGKIIENGNAISIATQFEKVSSVIKYLNYWQDQYLDLRKQKRNLDGPDPSFDKSLDITRSIQSEIGEFLRILRSQDYITFENFTKTKFEKFFRKNGWNHLSAQLKTKEMIPLDHVNIEEDLDISLSDIPGMNLLEKNDTPEYQIEESKTNHDSTEEEVKEVIQEEKTEREIELLNKLSGLKNDIQEINAEPEIESSIFELKSIEQIVEEEIKEELEFQNDEDDLLKEFFSEDEENVAPSDIQELKDSIQEIQAEFDLDYAKNLLENGDILGASKILQEEIQENPNNFEARHLYGILLSDHINNEEEAIEQWSYNRKQFRHTESILRLAEIAELNYDYKQVRKLYEEILENAPSYPGIHYKLGLLLEQRFKSKKKAAAKHFRIASEMDEDNTDAAYRYAQLLTEYLDKPKKAVRVLQRIIQTNPNHAEAHFDLAVLYNEFEKNELAHQYYNDACVIKPELRTDKNDILFQIEEAEESIEDPVLDLSKSLVLDHGTDGIEHEAEEKEPIIEDISEESASDTEEEVLAEISVEVEDDTYDMNDLEEDGLLENGAIIETPMLDELEEQIESSLGNGGDGDEVEELSFIEETDKENCEDKKTTWNVMITGATAGIGRATAIEFAKHGHSLILTGRRKERLEILKETLEEEYGVQIEILAFDVRHLDACQNALNSLGEHFRNIDILINNAGLAKGFGAIHEGNIHHWETMIDTNIKGLLYITRLVAPGMVQRKKGHIINLCSVAGKDVYPDGNVYCATKHAVDALTKAMRIDMHQYGIRVSQVCPGAVEETEFAKVRFDGDEIKARIYDDYQPLKSSDVADVIYFLANRPKHVNIQDVVMWGTQQASVHHIDKSGR